MTAMDQKPLAQRLAGAVRAALGPAWKTTRFLLAVMIPISLGVLLLERSGLLHWTAAWLDPFMRYFGLSGEASLVLITAALMNIYSAIAAIGTLPLAPREIAILAVMSLIAHNLIVECAVMKRTGSAVSRMVVLRLAAALAAGWFLNLVLPAGFGGAPAAAAAAPVAYGLSWAGLPGLLLPWAFGSAALILKIALIVTGLMVIQKVLEEFGLMELFGRIMAPFMRLLGLPASTGFLWIVANLIGLAYGAAIMIERAETGKLTAADGDLFNHHAAVSHSLLEDTLLFAAVGVPLAVLVLPRFALAVAAVWLERLRRVLFRRSFRVGTL
jgi:spore maturation protein SpmB